MQNFFYLDTLKEELTLQQATLLFLKRRIGDINDIFEMRYFFNETHIKFAFLMNVDAS